MAWGQKITISIYIQGELPPSGASEDSAVVTATQQAARVLEERGADVDFAGASISTVQDEPKESIAS